VGDGAAGSTLGVLNEPADPSDQARFGQVGTEYWVVRQVWKLEIGYRKLDGWD